MSVSVDPGIKIETLQDGEIHIVKSLTRDDLADLAIAFIQVSDHKMRPEDAKIVMRLKNLEAINYMIDQLTAARDKLYPPA